MIAMSRLYGRSWKFSRPSLFPLLLAVVTSIASCRSNESTEGKLLMSDAGALVPLDSVPSEAREAARNTYFFATNSVGGSCARSIGPTTFSVAYRAEEHWTKRSNEQLTVAVTLWVLGDVELLDSSSLATHRISERMAIDTFSVVVSRSASGRWTTACDSIRVYLPPADAGDSAMYVNPEERERLFRQAGVGGRD
jgi:hypothetical protein